MRATGVHGGCIVGLTISVAVGIIPPPPVGVIVGLTICVIVSQGVTVPGGGGGGLAEMTYIAATSQTSTSSMTHEA